MSLETKIMSLLKEAMKSKDQVALRVLRAIKGEILVAKTEKGASGELTEERELSILQKMAKQRKESYEVFHSQGKDDLAQSEKEELEFLQQFLPEQLSEEAIVPIVEKIITELNAKSMKDMGKVMGKASSELKGKADGSLISKIVKQKLS